MVKKLYNKSVRISKRKTGKEFIMEKKKTFGLGKRAQKVLLFSLPLMVFFAFALMLYAALLDGMTLLRERETVIMLLETVSRISVCVALGTVLADYAERKRR